MAMVPREQTRALAPFEKWYFWRNELGMYSNFRIAAHYKRDLTPELVCQVLARMVARHPSLAMNVYQGGNIVHDVEEDNVDCRGPQGPGNVDEDLHFRFMPSIKLEHVLEVMDDPNMTITTLFDTLQSRRFYYGGSHPLWKVILLNKQTLVYYSDHVLFDGTSGSNFHMVFSKEMAQLERESNKCSELGEPSEFVSSPAHCTHTQKTKSKRTVFDLNHAPPSYQLAPNPAKFLDYTVPIHYLLYIVMIFYLPRVFSNAIQYYIDDSQFANKKSYNILAAPRRKPSAASKDTCRHVHIKSETMRKLLAQCKANKVKFTSLLVILALVSIKSITGPDNDTMTIVPVNSRFQLQQSVDTNFGLYLGDVHIELPALDKVMDMSGQINWPLVQYVNRVIQTNKTDSQRDLGLVSWINPRDFLKSRRDDHDPNQMCATLVVSNLGYVNDPHGNLGDMWFDQPCQSATLGLFSLSVIGSKNGVNLLLRSMKPQWLETFSAELGGLFANV